MEELGYIEIRVNNAERSLTPRDVDINETKTLISSIEDFLFPTREEKNLRPQVSYDISSGSALHRFFVPISVVILFNGLTSEISKRDSLDFLDQKRQEVIYRFQQRSLSDGVRFEFNSSLTADPTLTVTNETNFEMAPPQFYESEFYLFGEIYQEGGKKPNIHITTSKFGNLVVSATKEQILDGEKKTYKPYGIKVKGKKSLSDGKLSDLRLIEFINYRPVYDRGLLDRMIKRASPNLSKITNVDSWIEELKSDAI